MKHMSRAMIASPRIDFYSRADGGPIEPWGTYTVGERGPELVIPNLALIPKDKRRKRKQQRRR